MQERISTFTIFLKKERPTSRKERRLCSDKKYQQKADEQLAVAHRLVGEDKKDHTEKQKLLKSYITAENTAEPRKHGRAVFLPRAMLFLGVRRGTFLARIGSFAGTFALSSLLAMRHLGRAYGRLAARGKGRKGVSAVIARKLDRYLVSAVSLLS